MTKERVIFKGGTSVTLDAWLFALDLEHRGIELLASADGRGVDARPVQRLTAMDLCTLADLSDDLRTLVLYEPPETIQ